MKSRFYLRIFLNRSGRSPNEVIHIWTKLWCRFEILTIFNFFQTDILQWRTFFASPLGKSFHIFFRRATWRVEDENQRLEIIIRHEGCNSVANWNQQKKMCQSGKIKSCNRKVIVDYFKTKRERNIFVFSKINVHLFTIFSTVLPPKWRNCELRLKLKSLSRLEYCSSQMNIFYRFPAVVTS